MDNLEKLNGSDDNRPTDMSGENVTPADLSEAHEQEPHPGTEQDHPKQEEGTSSPVPADIPVKSDVKKIPKPRKPRKPLKISLGAFIVGILLAGLLVFQTTYVALTLEHERDLNEAYARFSGLDKLIEIAELYDKEYLYEVDSELLDETLSRMYILSSGDRYASYYTAEEWAASVSSSAGDSVGIGVYVVPLTSGEIEIAHVMSGSPAENAGIRKGDILIAVDGQKISEVGYDAAVNAISGEVGSVVIIDILRDGTTSHLEVTRGHYTVETIVSEIMEKDGKKYGYIRIIEFMQVTVSQFKNAVNSMIEAGVEGFIFDVRDNPGGELSAICDILDFLLPEGPIAHIIDANGEEIETYRSDVKEIDLPMMVLANENTASAAELFTSALKDYDKAEVVGTRTYGKGCGQQGFYLSDGSVVFITNFFYNPPFSENYDGIGITPDIAVTLPEELQNENLFLIEHSQDTQLAAALEAIHSHS